MRPKSFLFVIAVAILNSCQQANEPKLKETYLDLPEVPYQYNDFGSGNNDVPTLGRVLFYDTRLSANNSVSCASCHKQALAFADNAQFSTGFAGRPTGRNSMPIQNLAQSFGFFEGDPGIPIDSGVVGPQPHTLFWDGRETMVVAQVLMPITNHIEMGMTIDELTKKLSSFPEYQTLFTKAFGTSEVTKEKISIGLASFVSSINSVNSKFDQYLRGQTQLTPEEELGRVVFFEKYDCNSCHQVTIPNGYQEGGGFVDTGLDRDPKDVGRYDVTLRTSDLGRFKIPTLRNVVLTGPYMHDGRFNTLDEVIEHYSTGIKNSANLDFRLRTAAGPKQFLISDADKQNLVAFLNTLTDYQMITDPKFSTPFKTK
jgi:cytochrome c peroxidase